MVISNETKKVENNATERAKLQHKQTDSKQHTKRMELEDNIWGHSEMTKYLNEERGERECQPEIVFLNKEN